MKRLFVAIDLADNQYISQLIGSFSRHLHQDKIRWVKPENIHLTLQFLGPIHEERLPKIISNTEATLESHQAIYLKFEKLGIFGSRYKPRVIWLGFESSPELMHIAEKLKQGMIKQGFRDDRQNFVPHITLGRVSKIESKHYFQAIWKKHGSWTMPPIEVKEIKLLESVLHKDGSEYQSLRIFGLRGCACD